MISREDVARRIRSVTVMGGTLFEEGNYSMHVEWNFSNDPRALETVYLHAGASN